MRKGKSGTFSDARLTRASHHAIVPNVNTRSEWATIYPKLAEDKQKLFSAIARRYTWLPSGRIGLRLDRNLVAATGPYIRCYRYRRDRARVAGGHERRGAASSQG